MLVVTEEAADYLLVLFHRLEHLLADDACLRLLRDGDEFVLTVSVEESGDDSLLREDRTALVWDPDSFDTAYQWTLRLEDDSEDEPFLLLQTRGERSSRIEVIVNLDEDVHDLLARASGS